MTNASAQTGQGYELWLGYLKIEDAETLEKYRNATQSIYFENEGDILEAAQKEADRGLESMLDQAPAFTETFERSNTMVVAKRSKLEKTIRLALTSDMDHLGKEGFVIEKIRIKERALIVITAHDDVGILYGTFRFLQLMQTHQTLDDLRLSDAPKIDLRLLNHWDNLDRTIERGYAGFSLWNWQKLPEYIDQRYIDYARANASIGINGTVLTNVNANALVLTTMYLEKVAALANTFRPYGMAWR